MTTVQVTTVSLRSHPCLSLGRPKTGDRSPTLAPSRLASAGVSVDSGSLEGMTRGIETATGNTDAGGACVFCPDQLSGSSSDFDQAIASHAGGVIIPALGMMVPGYFLAVTKSHAHSVSELAAPELASFYGWAVERCREWSPLFGEYFIVEHGSCPGARSGSCIDHAHLHLVPLASEVGSAILNSSDVVWRNLPGAEDLAGLRGRGYVSIYLQDQLFVADDVRLPSQWLRRVIAKELGLSVWDWALEYGRPQLTATMLSLADANNSMVPVP